MLKKMRKNSDGFIISSEIGETFEWKVHYLALLYMQLKICKENKSM